MPVPGAAAVRLPWAFLCPAGDGVGVFTAGAACADGTADAIAELTGGVAWCSVLAASMAPPPNTASTATATPAAGTNAAGPRRAASGSSGTGNPDRVNGSARSAISARSSAASAEVSASRLSASCCRLSGRTSSGSMLTRASGLTWRCRCSPQISQMAMCRRTRLRSRGVSSPFQSSRIQDSSSHEPALDRATMSAPSAVSKWVLARVVRACAWLRGTPSASARSAP